MSALLQGGPAGYKDLPITRLPLYLRVVVDPSGKVDALDQLEDTAAADETIYVYMRAEQPMHVCGRNRVTESGWMAYYFPLPHVDGEQLRDNDAWREWATAQPAEPRPTSVCSGRNVG